MKAVASIPTAESLRDLVLETLCGKELLEPTQTPLYEAITWRSGQPCGVFFSVEGPRLVRLYALWVSDEDRILFYDASGERFHETRLCDAPDMSSVIKARSESRAA
jgi:hypothetical protein